MAMSTTLFAVTQESLDQLIANPDSIHELVSQKTFDTYIGQSLSYFLADGEEDDEYDDDDDDDDDDDESEEVAGQSDDDGDVAHPLATVVSGDQSVVCSRLENGAFFVVPVARVAQLSALLAKVKPSEVKKSVLDAELEEIMDGEIYEELEQIDTVDPDEAAEYIVKDLKSLVKFYDFAAKKSLAIVLYTT